MTTRRNATENENVGRGQGDELNVRANDDVRRTTRRRRVWCDTPVCVGADMDMDDDRGRRARQEREREREREERLAREKQARLEAVEQTVENDRWIRKQRKQDEHKRKMESDQEQLRKRSEEEARRREQEKRDWTDKENRKVVLAAQEAAARDREDRERKVREAEQEGAEAERRRLEARARQEELRRKRDVAAADAVAAASEAAKALEESDKAAKAFEKSDKRPVPAANDEDDAKAKAEAKAEAEAESEAKNAAEAANNANRSAADAAENATETKERASRTSKDADAAQRKATEAERAASESAKALSEAEKDASTKDAELAGAKDLARGARFQADDASAEADTASAAEKKAKEQADTASSQASTLETEANKADGDSTRAKTEQASAELKKAEADAAAEKAQGDEKTAASSAEKRTAELNAALSEQNLAKNTKEGLQKELDKLNGLKAKQGSTGTPGAGKENIDADLRKLNDELQKARENTMKKPPSVDDEKRTKQVNDLYDQLIEIGDLYDTNKNNNSQLADFITKNQPTDDKRSPGELANELKTGLGQFNVYAKNVNGKPEFVDVDVKAHRIADAFRGDITKLKYLPARRAGQSYMYRMLIERKKENIEADDILHKFSAGHFGNSGDNKLDDLNGSETFKQFANFAYEIRGPEPKSGTKSGTKLSPQEKKTQEIQRVRERDKPFIEARDEYKKYLQTRQQEEAEIKKIATRIKDLEEQKERQRKAAELQQWISEVERRKQEATKAADKATGVANKAKEADNVAKKVANNATKVAKESNEKAAGAADEAVKTGEAATNAKNEAESKRKDAESKRKDAESKRKDAESKRKDAESKRKDATTLEGQTSAAQRASDDAEAVRKKAADAATDANALKEQAEESKRLAEVSKTQAEESKNRAAEESKQSETRAEEARSRQRLAADSLENVKKSRQAKQAEKNEQNAERAKAAAARAELKENADRAKREAEDKAEDAQRKRQAAAQSAEQAEQAERAAAQASSNEKRGDESGLSKYRARVDEVNGRRREVERREQGIRDAETRDSRLRAAENEKTAASENLFFEKLRVSNLEKALEKGEERLREARESRDVKGEKGDESQVGQREAYVDEMRRMLGTSRAEKEEAEKKHEAAEARVKDVRGEDGVDEARQKLSEAEKDLDAAEGRKSDAFDELPDEDKKKVVQEQASRFRLRENLEREAQLDDDEVRRRLKEAEEELDEEEVRVQRTLRGFPRRFNNEREAFEHYRRLSQANKRVRDKARAVELARNDVMSRDKDVKDQEVRKRAAKDGRQRANKGRAEDLLRRSMEDEKMLKDMESDRQGRQEIEKQEKVLQDTVDRMRRAAEEDGVRDGAEGKRLMARVNQLEAKRDAALLHEYNRARSQVRITERNASEAAAAAEQIPAQDTRAKHEAVKQARAKEFDAEVARSALNDVGKKIRKQDETDKNRRSRDAIERFERAKRELDDRSAGTAEQARKSVAEAVKGMRAEAAAAASSGSTENGDLDRHIKRYEEDLMRTDGGEDAVRASRADFEESQADDKKNGRNSKSDKRIGDEKKKGFVDHMEAVREIMKYDEATRALTDAERTPGSSTKSLEELRQQKDAAFEKLQQMSKAKSRKLYDETKELVDDVVKPVLKGREEARRYKKTSIDASVTDAKERVWPHVDNTIDKLVKKYAEKREARRDPLGDGDFADGLDIERVRSGDIDIKAMSDGSSDMSSDERQILERISALNKMRHNPDAQKWIEAARELHEKDTRLSESESFPDYVIRGLTRTKGEKDIQAFVSAEVKRKREELKKAIENDDDPTAKKRYAQQLKQLTVDKIASRGQSMVNQFQKSLADRTQRETERKQKTRELRNRLATLRSQNDGGDDEVKRQRQDEIEDVRKQLAEMNASRDVAQKASNAADTAADATRDFTDKSKKAISDTRQKVETKIDDTSKNLEIKISETAKNLEKERERGRKSLADRTQRERIRKQERQQLSARLATLRAENNVKNDDGDEVAKERKRKEIEDVEKRLAEMNAKRDVVQKTSNAADATTDFTKDITDKSKKVISDTRQKVETKIGDTVKNLERERDRGRKSLADRQERETERKRKRRELTDRLATLRSGNDVKGDSNSEEKRQRQQEIEDVRKELAETNARRDVVQKTSNAADITKDITKDITDKSKKAISDTRQKVETTARKVEDESKRRNEAEMIRQKDRQELRKIAAADSKTTNEARTQATKELETMDEKRNLQQRVRNAATDRATDVENAKRKEGERQETRRRLIDTAADSRTTEKARTKATKELETMDKKRNLEQRVRNAATDTATDVQNAKRKEGERQETRRRLMETAAADSDAADDAKNKAMQQLEAMDEKRNLQQRARNAFASKVKTVPSGPAKQQPMRNVRRQLLRKKIKNKEDVDGTYQRQLDEMNNGRDNSEKAWDAATDLVEDVRNEGERSDRRRELMSVAADSSAKDDARRDAAKELKEMDGKRTFGQRARNAVADTVKGTAEDKSVEAELASLRDKVAKAGLEGPVALERAQRELAAANKRAGVKSKMKRTGSQSRVNAAARDLAVSQERKERKRLQDVIGSDSTSQEAKAAATQQLASLKESNSRTSFEKSSDATKELAQKASSRVDNAKKMANEVSTRMSDALSSTFLTQEAQKRRTSKQVSEEKKRRVGDLEVEVRAAKMQADTAANALQRLTAPSADQIRHVRELNEVVEKKQEEMKKAESAAIAAADSAGSEDRGSEARAAYDARVAEAVLVERTQEAEKSDKIAADAVAASKTASDAYDKEPTEENKRAKEDAEAKAIQASDAAQKAAVEKQSADADVKAANQKKEAAAERAKKQRSKMSDAKINSELSSANKENRKAKQNVLKTSAALKDASRRLSKIKKEKGDGSKPVSQEMVQAENEAKEAVKEALKKKAEADIQMEASDKRLDAAEYAKDERKAADTLTKENTTCIL